MLIKPVFILSNNLVKYYYNLNEWFCILIYFTIIPNMLSFYNF